MATVTPTPNPRLIGLLRTSRTLSLMRQWAWVAFGVLLVANQQLTLGLVVVALSAVNYAATRDLVARRRAGGPSRVRTGAGVPLLVLKVLSAAPTLVVLGAVGAAVGGLAVALPFLGVLLVTVVSVVVATQVLFLAQSVAEGGEA